MNSLGEAYAVIVSVMYCIEKLHEDVTEDVQLL